jgi:hypothetical protein
VAEIEARKNNLAVNVIVEKKIGGRERSLSGRGFAGCEGLQGSGNTKG